MRAPYIEVQEAVPASALMRPGLYLASSTTAGYGALLAAVERGVVERVGSHAMPGMVQVVAVRRRGPAENPTIGISAVWYQRILADYADWKAGWWREAIQNAVDAGAKNIRCESDHQIDGTWLMSIEDDGTGMDEQILVDKFLQMGGSTKLVGSTGGFGAAKELLILPWLRWQIHTGSLIAEGIANYYELRTAAHRKGVRLEVTMPDDEHTSAEQALAFINKCYLPNVRFTVIRRVEGEEFETWTPKANLRTRDKDLLQVVQDKAALYATKVDYRPYMIYVRANGLFMFERGIGETKNKQIICEITAPSVEVLTKNRDGFRDWRLQNAVEEFGRKVAKDTSSALLSKAGIVRKKYRGIGKFEVRRRKAEVLEQIGPIIPAGTGVEIHPPTYLDDLSRLLISSINFSGPTHVENAIGQLVWSPDFFLFNEIEGFRVPSKFRPEKMSPTVVKLVSVWAELCRFVLMQLGFKETYGVGLLFSQDHAAMYLYEEGEHWLFLNPYKDVHGRTQIWSPSKLADRKWLYAAAVHECTHLTDDIDHHDESFAAALTVNIARTADGFRKVGAITRAITRGTIPALHNAPEGNPRAGWEAAKQRLLA